MTNHFLTTLMNLSDNGDASEHVSRGIGAKSLNGVLTDVYLLLFPNPTDREDIKFRAYCYLRLVEASGFGHYIGEVDTKLTYNLDTDFNFMAEHSFDLTATMRELNKQAFQIDQMFEDIELEDKTPRQLWKQHSNPVHRLAGVVIGFVQRAD